MTDNEIIKALKCCSTEIRENTCPKCVFYKKHRCSILMLYAVSDLISRQKAEIKRLTAKILAKDNVNDYNTAQLRIARNKLNKYPIKTVVGNNCEIHSKTSKDYDNLIADIKSEAIKEFAERLKSKLQWDCEFSNKLVFENDIDNLVKEMTEVQE